MTGLFARLYLDEDVSARTAELIAARGFDILTTLQAGRLASSDRSQLEFAAQQKRTILTHNRRDFERLATEFFNIGISHAGIMIAVRRTPREMAERILQLLNQRTAEELIDQMLYL